jgi:monofunctional biosynthetic peptidoglycan transglycosylase
MKKFLLSSLILFFVSCTSLLVFIYLQVPSIEEIKGCIKTTMYAVNLCPGTNSYVPLKAISPILQKSIILTEDSSFFQHEGFDWDAIEKNAREALEKKKFKRGGSTISQQLAKNMFLSKEKTLWRKFIEMLITQKIETVLTKKEILERYLNVIEFGKNIYGIKAASQFYFQKHPSNLTVVESAFLAMLLPNPKKYSASFYKKELTPFARRRMKHIINDMFTYKRINEEQYATALVDFENFLKPFSSIESNPGEASGTEGTVESSSDGNASGEEPELREEDAP